MSEENNPSWIRLLDDATGVIVITVAIAAFLELAFSISFAIEILSIGLLVMGIAWVIWGVYILRVNRYARVFMLITGISVIGLALVDFILFSLPPDFLIIFPAVGMILIGLSRIVLGVLIRDIPLWIQMLQVLSGILTINLAAFVFIFTNVGFEALLIFLVIAQVMNGLVRLITTRSEVPEKCSECADDVI
jgi:hypothetical protein